MNAQSDIPHLRIERDKTQPRWTVFEYRGWPDWSKAKYVGTYSDWPEAMRAAYQVAYPPTESEARPA